MGVETAIAGAASGIVGVVIGHPFDTVKVRLQTGVHKSTFDALRHLVLREGWGSLYRGVSAPLTTMAVKRSLEFSVFERVVQNNNAFVAGAVSGATTTFLGCPMQVVKINLQNTDRRTLSGASDFCRELLGRHGWQGFYLGLKVNLAKDIVFGAMYLGSYAECRKRLPDTPLGHFLSGGLASLALWTPLYPIDLIKTQIQSQTHGTVRESVVQTVKKNGLFGMWRGLLMVWLRVFPTSACSMAVYETVRSLFSGNSIKAEATVPVHLKDATVTTTTKS